MSDFGNAGKLTIRTDNGAVMVKAGQQIQYTLTVQGEIPVFTFACTHKDRLTEESFPQPQQKYSWTWKYPADADGADDVYVVQMSFLTALKYTLRAELQTANGNLLSVIKDLDAESDDSNDKYPSSIEVIAI
jgi:hypothetical protein